MRNGIIFVLLSVAIVLIIGGATIFLTSALFLWLFALTVLKGNTGGEAGLAALLPMFIAVPIGGILAIFISFFICMYISEKLHSFGFIITRPRKLFLTAVVLSPITFITLDFIYALIVTSGVSN